MSKTSQVKKNRPARKTNYDEDVYNESVYNGNESLERSINASRNKSDENIQQRKRNYTPKNEVVKKESKVEKKTSKFKIDIDSKKVKQIIKAVVYRDYGNLFKISAVVILIVGSIMLSPLFQIKEIRIINNNTQFTLSEIKDIASIKEGNNIFTLSKRRVENKLEGNIYIANAEITKTLPDVIEITLSERRVRGYVPYMGSYLYIDEEGRVLDTQSTYYEPLPEVGGLKFSKFRLGEVLEVENPDSLDVVLQMSQMMQKYELLDLTLNIDVANAENIIVYINQVEVFMGNIIDIDQKVRIMAEILKTIPEEDRGSVDLSDLTKPIVFKYLT